MAHPIQHRISSRLRLVAFAIHPLNPLQLIEDCLHIQPDKDSPRLITKEEVLAIMHGELLDTIDREGGSLPTTIPY